MQILSDSPCPCHEVSVYFPYSCQCLPSGTKLAFPQSTSVSCSMTCAKGSSLKRDLLKNENIFQIFFCDKAGQWYRGQNFLFLRQSRLRKIASGQLIDRFAVKGSQLLSAQSPHCNICSEYSDFASRHRCWRLLNTIKKALSFYIPSIERLYNSIEHMKTSYGLNQASG